MDDGPLGKGTYGSVFPYKDAFGATPKCVKVLHRLNCDTAFHQMAFASYVRDLAAMSGCAEFVVQHLVLPERLLVLKDKRHALVMEQHRRDLFSAVMKDGRMRGQELEALHDALCGAVGWLNDRRIYFCDISPSNTLQGYDGRWRLTDPDLWRGCELDTEAYCRCLRPPEMLLNYTDLDLGKYESWAVGMTLDFGNRGYMGKPSSARGAARDRKYHPCGKLPSISRRVPDPGRQHELQSSDWDLYADLVELRPSDRRRLGQNVTAELPPAPWQRITGAKIDKGSRQAYIAALMSLSEDGVMDPTVMLVSITLVDVWLAQKTEPSQLASDVLAACVYLAQTHTQRYSPALQDWCERLSEKYGHVDAEAVQRRAEELMAHSMWQPPLGRHVWTTHDWATVHDMIFRPQETYARFA